jgi:hypothetical protein
MWTSLVALVAITGIAVALVPEVDKLADDEKLDRILKPDAGKGFERPDQAPESDSSEFPMAPQLDFNRPQVQMQQTQMKHSFVPFSGGIDRQQPQEQEEQQPQWPQEQQQPGGDDFPQPPMVPPVPMMEDFPPRPPQGYEAVLPAATFNRLLAVHANTSLTVAEKKKQIDGIMNELPQETLDLLPLPPALYRLPGAKLIAIRAIFTNKSLSFDEKNDAVRKFVRSLPIEERRLVRPPLPRGFENLPQETKDKIDELYEMEGLGEDERYAKILKVVMMLPPELRAKIPPPPARMASQIAKSMPPPLQGPPPRK